MTDGFGELLRGTASCYVVDNLAGVPSYHYEPIFAQDVARAIVKIRPNVIALELPPGLEGERRWAIRCWPGPVVALSRSAFFPFVPGDSILEGLRLANDLGIEIALIDAWVPDHLRERTPEEQGRGELSLPGPELAPHGRSLFIEGVQATLDSSGEFSPVNLMREANMALKLAQLMDSHRQVLWIGGMEHWRNIVGRLRRRLFDAPSAAVTSESTFRRMRLAPSALYRMTQRLPFLVSAYAENPVGYDETAVLRSLALKALTIDEGAESHLVISLPGVGEPDDSLTDPERGSSIDAARVLLYARNLAMTHGVREQPNFGELLTAASATIGPLYAGRVYEIAMEERSSPDALALDKLEYDVRDGRETYFCGEEIIDARPWLPPRASEIPLAIAEIRRRAREEIFRDLPKKEPGAKQVWECYPPDWEPYEAFVNYLMRRASVSDPGDVRSIPFSSGMRDGLDVRATLKHWVEGKIFVREERRGTLNFTNAAIDWTGTTEYSDQLQGRKPGAWTDPSQDRLGSYSKEYGHKMKVIQEDPWIQLSHREFSLLTLDLPTWRKGEGKGGVKSFYTEVIYPLVELQSHQMENDNLYSWLEIMFRFCAGKPFAYYSRYAPSPRVHRVAWRHKVEVVHFPLQRIPNRLLKRNQAFRFMSLTRAQWEELHRRRSDAAGTWGGRTRPSA
jgi:hypothetical protein